MKTMLFPYSSSSKGAKRMADALRIAYISRDEQDFECGKDERVINWGNSFENLNGSFQNILDENWLNTPKAVSLSVDKIATFRILDKEDLPTPFWTTSQEVAQEWSNEGRKVVLRFNEKGMQGKDIGYAEPYTIIPEAKFYTQFFEHDTEIRVHVVNGTTIEILDKTDNGFQGTHTGNAYSLTPVQWAMLSRIAEKVITTLRLHFGAVDFLWNSTENIGTILEVNTAPSVENGTLQAYTQAFKSKFNI